MTWFLNVFHTSWNCNNWHWGSVPSSVQGGQTTQALEWSFLEWSSRTDVIGQTIIQHHSFSQEFIGPPFGVLLSRRYNPIFTLAGALLTFLNWQLVNWALQSLFFILSRERSSGKWQYLFFHLCLTNWWGVIRFSVAVHLLEKRWVLHSWRVFLHTWRLFVVLIRPCPALPIAFS